MKKLLTGILAVCLALCLFACGPDYKDVTANVNDAEVQQTISAFKTAASDANAGKSGMEMSIESKVASAGTNATVKMNIKTKYVAGKVEASVVMDMGEALKTEMYYKDGYMYTYLKMGTIENKTKIQSAFDMDDVMDDSSSNPLSFLETSGWSKVELAGKEGENQFLRLTIAGDALEMGADGNMVISYEIDKDKKLVGAEIIGNYNITSLGVEAKTEVKGSIKMKDVSITFPSDLDTYAAGGSLFD